MKIFRFGLRASALLCVVYALGSVPAFAAVSGEAVYARRCAVCHEQVNDHIPSHETLKTMPATRIMRTMDFGAMMSIAYPLSREEREAVAKYIGTDAKDTPPPASAFCSDRKVKLDDKTKFVWNGWSPGNDNTRFEPASVAGLTVDQLKRLKLKWAYGFDGDVTAFAAPTVIGNQIFVGSAGGQIQALHADSGCIQWTYNATGPVRAGMRVAPLGSGHVLLFGDQTGWFYAVSAETGKELWKKKIEEHDTARLTATAVVNDGVVYATVASWEETRSNNPDYTCCSFRGSVVAMRIKDGSQVWKAWMVGETKESGKTAAGKVKTGPSGASIWATPTIDSKRKLMYVTTGDNFSLPATPTSDALVAIDLATGKIVWSKQVTENDVSPSERGPDFDFGSSPMLVKTPAGKDLVIAGQKSGIVYAFDPDKQGELLWQTRVGKGSAQGGVQWGTASDGRYVFAATSDKVTTRSTGPDGQPVRSLDPAKGGGLTALRIADGTQAWFAKPDPCSVPGCSPAQSGAVTAIPGIVFSGSYDGHVRAYSAEDGKVLWDFDTLQTFDTVNGIKAKGGAMDGAGPVIVNGMVLVNSGYPRFGGLPGNVLLAFTPDGK
ncbi:MAG TPA: PQQ-binding-like beta-propeller repeat protein [Bryobacteraceae bacterium]|nr:PQQ-binding-like beta-propeller repeat protein [Bryobacteraceae bacterium]